jgi:hypothetical protein
MVVDASEAAALKAMIDVALGRMAVERREKERWMREQRKRGGWTV